MEYKIGDTVQLKSGGPIMTVQAVGPKTVVAVWFNQEGSKFDLQTNSFAPDTLKHK